MKAKSPVLQILYEYGIVTVGCAAYALSFNWFFQPNNISMGGFTGIAQIVNRLLPFMPVGITAILLNVPLFYLGVRKMGLKFLLSSLYAVAVSSLMLDGLAMLYTFQPMDALLACIYGGVLLGISSGMLLTVGATTGGTELAARLLKFRFRNLSIGRLCLTLDVTVIFLYALTFHNVNYTLYGIVAMYISSLAIDAVVYGSVNAKMAYIISENGEEMKKRLLALNLGLTLMRGKGGFSGDERQVILCAFKRSQIAAIKAAVTETDPKAFIIVCEAHEVLGEGFGEYDPDSL
ncbi:MAG: YitT family protein [Oscillospiraceae bacterium]|nr:YitT family protein [Oscillospiraceae bacterium]